MKGEKRLIAYTKVLDIYKKADSFILTLLNRNCYERHITDWGLESTFFVFGYDIKKLVELEIYQTSGPQKLDKDTSRQTIINVLKGCINELKK